jgi:uncharacterized membrane-anchored protein YjiN (DUF445 family)
MATARWRVDHLAIDQATLTDICQHVYPASNHVEKKHRVAVARTLRTMARRYRDGSELERIEMQIAD